MWHIKKRFTQERDEERGREGDQLGNWRFILKIKRAEINEQKYFLQCSSIKNKKKNEMKLKYFAIVK